MARPPLRLQCGACSVSSSAICKESHTLYRMYPRLKREERPKRLCEASSRHATGKPYSCTMPGCDYKTARIRNILKHIRVHGDNKQYRYNVQLCGYTAICIGRLNKHMRRHTCKKSLRCNAPGYGYIAPSDVNLKSHMRTHMVMGSKAGR